MAYRDEAAFTFFFSRAFKKNDALTNLRNDILY